MTDPTLDLISEILLPEFYSLVRWRITNADHLESTISGESAQKLIIDQYEDFSEPAKMLWLSLTNSNRKKIIKETFPDGSSIITFGTSYLLIKYRMNGAPFLAQRVVSCSCDHNVKYIR